MTEAERKQIIDLVQRESGFRLAEKRQDNQLDQGADS